MHQIEAQRQQSRWKFTDPFFEHFQKEGLTGHLVGLAATHTASATEVTGSSFDFIEKIALEKARSELCERMTIVELIHSGKTSHSLKDPNCTISRSNGWAAHPDLANAKASACLELLERDRVLRYWYSGRKPKPLSKDLLPFWPVELPDSVGNRMQLYSLPDPHSDAEVCMAAIVPRPNSDPRFIVHGFGAGLDLEAAIASACRETIQRWAFLYEECAEPGNQNQTNTPDFHQDYLLSPLGQKKLIAWTSGDLSLGLEIPTPKPLLRECSVEIYSTPLSQIAEARNTLFVCKDSHPNALPLVFGSQPQTVLKWLPNNSARWWHPIP